MSTETSPWLKLKLFAGVEFVLFLIALVMPVTPNKTGRPFHWPATWSEYFGKVLYSFILGNAVVVVIFLVGWILVRLGVGEKKSGLQDGGQSAAQAGRDTPHATIRGPGADSAGLSAEEEFKPHGSEFHGDH